MRKGDISNYEPNSIGVCLDCLVDRPQGWKGFKLGCIEKWGHVENTRHLFNPRLTNIFDVQKLAAKYNLYIYTTYPRRYDKLIPQLIYPLGFVGIVFYRPEELRVEVERRKLKRFLASTPEQVTAIGNDDVARLYDLAWKYEKELFNGHSQKG